MTSPRNSSVALWKMQRHFHDKDDEREFLEKQFILVQNYTSDHQSHSVNIYQLSNLTDVISRHKVNECICQFMVTIVPGKGPHHGVKPKT